MGQALIILIPETVHTVKEGDSLFTIARLYGVTELQLMQRNPEAAVNRTIYPGQQLVINYRDQGRTEKYIYGFIYPNINETVLRRTLPYASGCAIFGYGFTREGELLSLNDTSLIDTMYSYKVAPYMLITSLTEDGNFDSDIASLIFNNSAIQNRVIENVLSTMEEKGYLGLDIDFEYIKPEDRDAYSSFVENITTRLNERGYTVNVDLAPKVSDTQQGSVYEGHDYAAIGAAANTVMLMTYEWGYTYGPPRAIAPIDEVRRVVEYAVSVIDNSKILLGIPNYAYDWTLPYQKGVSRATGIGNETALRIAAENRAEIQFDDVSASPFFEYNDAGGNKHIVWFEDVRSIREKFNLVDEFSLRGAGYWNFMNPFSSNWSYVGTRYNIFKIE